MQNSGKVQTEPRFVLDLSPQMENVFSYLHVYFQYCTTNYCTCSSFDFGNIGALVV